jgi:hypothetical protein
MKKNIENSIVADQGSSISNSKNITNTNIRKIKTEYSIIGFILGVLASIIASYIYAHFIK